MAKRDGLTVGKEMEQEMVERLGFVPQFFRATPDATLPHSWALMRDFCLGESVLPNKVKELIGLAVAAHIKCRYCVYFHTQTARAYGATDQELREAAFQGGFTALNSNALTGGMVDLEAFKREVDRAVAHMQSHGAPAPAPRH